MARPRAIQSGWCNSGFHGRCSFELQTATEKRRRIECSCVCHKRRDGRFYEKDSHA